MPNYSPKGYDSRRLQDVRKDPTPWHRFKRELKAARVRIQVFPPRWGYCWGFDERSLSLVLGNSFAKYKQSSWRVPPTPLAFLLGPGMFAGRDGQKLAIYWIALEFLVGLITVSLKFNLLLPVVVATRLAGGFLFQNYLLVKVMRVYNSFATTHSPVEVNTHKVIAQIIGWNPAKAVLFLGVEVFVFATLALINFLATAS